MTLVMGFLPGLIRFLPRCVVISSQIAKVLRKRVVDLFPTLFVKRRLSWVLWVVVVGVVGSCIEGWAIDSAEERER